MAFMSKQMKVQTDRWIVLPFSLRCSSRSSVDVGSPSPPNDATIATSRQGRQKGRQGRQKDSAITKKSKSFLSFRLPKSKFSHGIQSLIRSFNSFPQFIFYKEEMEEEEEQEMEIGYPTDVKHLTHIGWDGSTTISNATKGWENLTPSEIISFPSISLKQFEVAMTQQAAAAGDKHV